MIAKRGSFKAWIRAKRLAIARLRSKTRCQSKDSFKIKEPCLKFRTTELASQGSVEQCSSDCNDGRTLEGGNDDKDAHIEAEANHFDRPESASELVVGPLSAWDFPLSRGEKARQSIRLFQASLEHDAHELRDLQRENADLHHRFQQWELEMAQRSGNSSSVEAAVEAVAEATAARLQALQEEPCSRKFTHDFTWDFPLTRAEKVWRVLSLFQARAQASELRLQALQEENDALRHASRPAYLEEAQSISHAGAQVTYIN